MTIQIITCCSKNGTEAWAFKNEEDAAEFLENHRGEQGKDFVDYVYNRMSVTDYRKKYGYTHDYDHIEYDWVVTELQ